MFNLGNFVHGLVEKETVQHYTLYSESFVFPQPSSTTLKFHGSCGVLSVE